MEWRGNLPPISLRGRQVLHSQAFSFECGVSFLVGRNGAGKTTFLRSVLGLIGQSHCAESILTLDDRTTISSVDRGSLMSHLGYLPQDVPSTPTLTCWQFVLHAGWLKGLAQKTLQMAARDVLEKTNLISHQHIRMDRLSGGMRRRAGLAAALVHNPALVLLDEPTAGLDPLERQQFHDHISHIAPGKIVLFSTHLDDDVGNVDGAIVVLKQGRLEHVTTPAAERPRVAELLARDP